MACAFLLLLIVSTSFAAAPPDESPQPQAEGTIQVSPPPEQSPDAAGQAQGRSEALAPSQPAAVPDASQPPTGAAPQGGEPAPVAISAAVPEPAAPGEPPQTGAAPAAIAQPNGQTSSPSCPPDYLPVMQRTLAMLMKDDFSYVSNKVVDPFVPFIQPAAAPVPEARTLDSEEDEAPPEPQKPLTPLQKMTMTELETGLKAITWGDYGRRALIEDSAGKGYIVAVGTPVADRNGVVAEIFNDSLVIHQEIWDKRAKKMLAEDSVLKLKKKEAKK